ncbi:MAG: hypothetical protein K6F01_03995 [Selenomonas sp.]|uniref:hypothetical protein n=1 Tax=Selenomonas sp. TaxID=2053611 RepID=UPI0025F752E1|nr:hypothetical protein [Selenomonas sp.]MCR5438582.1 hypothetical protein [Selenomonas sp.]
MENRETATAEWRCSCGQSGNKGNFCVKCGKPRPVSQPQAPQQPQQPPMQQMPPQNQQPYGQQLYGQVQYGQPNYQPQYQQPIYGQPAYGQPYQQPEDKNKNKNLKIGLGVAVLFLVLVLVFFGMKEGAFGDEPASSNYSSVSKNGEKAAPNQNADKKQAGSREMQTDLSLGGMDLGMTVAQMHETLGQEISTKQKDGMVFYQYPTVEVGTSGDIVTSLVSETDSAVTKRGLHQGSSLSEVKNTYGTDYMKSEYGGKDLYEYRYTDLQGQMGILRFAVVQGTDTVNYISIRRTTE